MDYTRAISADTFDLYIFDLDGTLVDSLADLTFAINKTLSQFNLPPLSEAQVRQGVGLGARNIVLNAFKLSGTFDETSINSMVDEALPYYLEFYEANCTRTVSLYPGMMAWLEYLQTHGKKMAVLTNKGDDATKRIIQSLNGEHFFSVIAGPDYAGVLKPESGGILRIIKETGVSPTRTIMVGDSMVDFEAGRNAGISVCGITGGLGDDDALRNAGCDYLIERPSVST